MVMSPSQARHPSFTQHLHWKVGKFYADADGFIEYLIFAVGWLGRMEIGNPSMITLTFEVWHLRQLCQGESDIDAILVLMVAVSAASVTCVEVSICRSARLDVMDSIGTIVTGSEDTRIPGPARTRLDQDQGKQDRGRCWIRSIRIEEPHDQLVLSHHTGSVHVHRPCLARASKGVSMSSVRRSAGQMSPLSWSLKWRHNQY